MNTKMLAKKAWQKYKPHAERAVQEVENPEMQEAIKMVAENWFKIGFVDGAAAQKNILLNLLIDPNERQSQNNTDQTTRGS